ncbi:MAG: Na+:solute symporter [Planctomycetaceae bacterium]|jgi:Na+/proline symporter|nr:Na+:solute symporter [Planctomycetaceae bacterium]
MLAALTMGSLDWIVLILSLAVCFFPALFFGKRSGKNTSEFFASGRSVPWWLIGVSMVATTFAADTPNLVTQFVREQGVAGNWAWWAFTLTGVATVFFYARLWRRSEVMTDLEFYHARYSGKIATFVRGFRAVYLGFFFNCIILGNVNLAACKIAGILFGFDSWQTLLTVGFVDLAFAMYAGLWGALVIDMFQFCLMMTGITAMAYFAVNNETVGGLHVMIEKVGAMSGPNGIHYLNMFPDFTNNWEMAVAVFVMPLAVQWWATWYPGSEPGGGSYIAQRMLASKSEKDALGGVLFFNVAHYVLRPWPWMITALASLVVFPTLPDIHAAFPHLDKNFLGNDIAYPAMMRFLPAGFFGLMVAALFAARSSTFLTHLNWGASYCVHDFYRLFIAPGQSEKHYVLAGRLAILVIFIASGLMVFVLESAKDGFGILLQIGAGTGLLYLVRWFWWRVNAWCELTAMIVSFLVSALFLTGDKLAWWCSNTEKSRMISEQFGNGIIILSTHQRLLITVAVTTAAWILTAFLTPKTDMNILVQFYRKVKPGGRGWEPVRKAAGIRREEVRNTGDSLPMALVGWSCGCAMIWSSLFLVGNLLYGRTFFAAICGTVFVASTAGTITIVNKLWK